MDAFEWLKDQEGMVQCLGSYTYNEKLSDKTMLKTYNILLEFGEQDLEEYFAEAPPPVLKSKIVAFWRSLFEIAGALKKCHNSDLRYEDGSADRIAG